jgi:hypothetical protein
MFLKMKVTAAKPSMDYWNNSDKSKSRLMAAAKSSYYYCNITPVMSNLIKVANMSIDYWNNIVLPKKPLVKVKKSSYYIDKIIYLKNR